MLTVVLIILGSALLVLQTTLLSGLPGWIGSPDLIFLLILYMACRLDAIRGLILTLFFGLIMDIFSGFTPGLYPSTYAALFVTIKLLSRHLIIDEPTHQPPLAAATYLISSGAIYIYNKAFFPESGLYWSWRDLLLEVFILTILTLPVFHLLDLLVKALDPGQKPRLMSLSGKSGNRFIR